MKIKNRWHQRSLTAFFLYCGLLAVIWLWQHPQAPRGGAAEVPVDLDTIQEYFPEASAFVSEDGIPGSLLAENENGETVGRFVVSGPAAANVFGYGGPTPLGVVIGTDNAIRAVHLFPNSESEEYMMDVVSEGLPSAWNGLSPEKAVAHPVDAVSGATYSSKAIIKTVRLTLAPFDQQVVVRQAGWRFGFRQLVIVILLVFDLLLFFRLRWIHRLRKLILSANVVILGFWFGDMLSLSLLGAWLDNGIPPQAWLGLGLVALLALLLPLLTSRSFYCAHVCPFGSLQELFALLPPKKSRKLSPVALDILKIAGFLLFALSWFLLLFGRRQWLGDLEPFSAFNYKIVPLGMLGFAIVLLLLTKASPRLWCRYLCPTGRFLEFCRGAKPARAFVALGMLLSLSTAGWLAWNSRGGPPQTENKNDVLTVIHGRKSVRRYTGEPVTQDELQILLRAGMAAPTAANLQPWSFVCVTDRERLAALAEKLEYGKMLKQAAAAIVVCGRPDDALPGKAKEMWVQDCSAASENILLAAEGIGLGAVWLGIHPLEDRQSYLRKILQIPEEVVPLNVISIGRPAGRERPRDKYNPENIHWQSWK